MVDRKKNLLLWASILPFQAGLIAMASVIYFNLMSTNVAGHFPRAFREILGHNAEPGLAILLNIGIYFMSALLTGCWVIKYGHNHRLMMVPYSLTLFILLVVCCVPLSNPLKLNLLFFAMANQNVFSASITEGVVKPSQMTGILIDLALNIGKYVSNNSSILPVIKAQLVLIGCFIAGLSVAFWTVDNPVFPSFYIAIVVQILILVFYFFKGKKV